MKNTLKKLLTAISYQENVDYEGFILRENRYDRQALQSAQGAGGDSGAKTSAGVGAGWSAESSQDEGKGQAGPESGAESGNGGASGDGGGSSCRRERRRTPKRVGRGKGKPQPGEEEEPTPRGRPPESQEALPGPAGKGPLEIDPGLVHTRLEENRLLIERIYGLPLNKDIIIRDFVMGSEPPLKCFIVYIDGLTDRQTLNPLLQDLMVFTRMFSPALGAPADFVLKNLLPGSQARVTDSFDQIVDSINYGDTAFFFQGSTRAVIVETKGWEHRAVSRPETEQTITGPQEGFTENLRVNTALVRKIVRSEKLHTEMFTVGERFRSDIAVLYLSDLADPELVAEVRRRVAGIKVDYINDTGILEQFIEDSPYSLNSQVISTERPDRVASYLADGKVALILSGSPYALVVPATMFEQLHTAEETYLRWHYGTFIRYVRTLSFYLALLLPGVYLAIVLFHQEMIPTDLLLAIAGSREKVPFPTALELLMLEFSFELVREAGVRIPGIIGSTIGIVGALILGQAAVQANIVSPVLVILVAATGLGSFSIPNYSLAFTVRIYRFAYIIAGATLGIFGITMVLFAQIIFTANLKSFGVPYLSPAGPRTYAGPDVVIRAPIFTHRRRPDYMNPQDDLRMPEEPRGWVKEGGPSGEGSR